jgi:hypothetical protein
MLTSPAPHTRREKKDRLLAVLREDYGLELDKDAPIFVMAGSGPDIFKHNSLESVDMLGLDVSDGYFAACIATAITQLCERQQNEALAVFAVPFVKSAPEFGNCGCFGTPDTLERQAEKGLANV